VNDRVYIISQTRYIFRSIRGLAKALPLQSQLLMTASIYLPPIIAPMMASKQAFGMEEVISVY